MKFIHLNKPRAGMRFKFKKDNKWSIEPEAGTLFEYLGKKTTEDGYNILHLLKHKDGRPIVEEGVIYWDNGFDDFMECAEPVDGKGTGWSSEYVKNLVKGIEDADFGYTKYKPEIDVTIATDIVAKSREEAEEILLNQLQFRLDRCQVRRRND